MGTPETPLATQPRQPHPNFKQLLKQYEKITDPLIYFGNLKDNEGLKAFYGHFEDIIRQTEQYLTEKLGADEAEKLFLDTDRPFSMIPFSELIKADSRSAKLAKYGKDAEEAYLTLLRYKWYSRAIIQILDDRGDSVV